MSYDLIVVGLGGIGSATCYWAARAGLRVLGLERFELGHVHGEGQDHSRIIRLAQHRQVYGRLASSAYTAWAEVEEDSGQRLVTPTGGLVVEAPAERVDHGVATGAVEEYAAVMSELGFAYETLAADELTARWPDLRLDGDERGLYDPAAGIVDAARANAVHTDLASARGAELRPKLPVTAIGPDGAGVAVETAEGTYRAERAVVASGPWTRDVLASVGRHPPLVVTQEQVTYYATPHADEFVPGRFPVLMWRGAHDFYGLPVYGVPATKLGEHIGGPEVTAETRTYTPDPVRQRRYLAFLDRRIPRFAGPELYTRTCLYTLTPDHHFIVDRLPEHPQIAVFVGAGHAFKFASLLGQLLVTLAPGAEPEHDLASFRIDRPALEQSLGPVC